ncbi:uncharacterized protein L201_002255 [Kwoniella dendrophila CBS 6074]|uniref:CFEM domain-containing protein n=1 Tax=Kwoniella dendrophila CBS 6074 TaxID=1295534 RepID=A0AAX4JQM8_9TREE
MKFTIFASIALASLASAQVSIPTCVVTCSTQAAAAAGCTSYTDVSCVCTNAAFQNAAGACLIANCTSEEQTAAVSLQSALCAGQSVTGGSVTASISATGSASSVDASAIASLTQSGASASSLASSIASSATSAISASSAAAASASRSATSGSASGSASATHSGSAAASGSASAASASASKASSANKLEFGFKGLLGSAVGIVGLVAGAYVAL